MVDAGPLKTIIFKPSVFCDKLFKTTRKDLTIKEPHKVLFITDRVVSSLRNVDVEVSEDPKFRVVICLMFPKFWSKAVVMLYMFRIKKCLLSTNKARLTFVVQQKH